MTMMHAQKPVRTVPPAVSPVSLIDAKAHLRVLHDDDDTIIQGCIDAAVSHLDGWGGILGRCIITQTWRSDLPAFCDEIRLPFPNVQSVTVAYTDAEGDPQTVAADQFHLVTDDMGGLIVRAHDATWPQVAIRPDAVRVTGVYGYGVAAAVPPALRAAILLHVGTLYLHRETMSERAEPNLAYEALVAPHRVVRL
jgi:uncharacterized phiE125 gp8 family phage protein